MKTVAYLNHGRWVADCPRDGCPEAHLTDEEVFVCGNCGCVALVEMPAARAEVDRITARRPVPQTRNWWPGESLEALRLENIAHGLE